MIIKLDHSCFFIFDLDDTLYYEIDYLRSGYRAISDYLKPFINEDIYSDLFKRYSHNPKENVFQWIIDKYPSIITKDNLLQIYRNHLPNISLNKDSEKFLNTLKKYNVRMGVVTDGRSNTQRNKLQALGIIDYFLEIVISEEFGSEKPDIRNFQYFKDKYPNSKFYFFGDNLKKDFISPLGLGWIVFCLLDKGDNIHNQEIKIEDHNQISFIKSFDDIELII